MAAYKYEMIVCIVNTGFSDVVMSAAREYGAKGGTVFSARGTANQEAETFFKISIQPEKEVVMILVPTKLKDDILHALYKQVGLNTPGQGIAFTLPRNNLNKNNIVEFLNGFYIHDSHEGIIEFLDDEHDDGKIKLENKVNIINSLIERAKEAGIDENQISGLLKDVVAHTRNYTGGWFGGKNCFNKDAEPWWKITLRNAIPGTFGCFGGTLDTITYNEVIDEEMKKLHAEIKAKEAQQAEQAQQDQEGQEA